MKINIKNAAKVQAALESVQARCRERLCTVDDIHDAISCIMDKVAAKADIKGLTIVVNPNRQTFPACYNGVPMATYASLYFSGRDWFLVGAKRKPCSNSYIVSDSVASEGILKNALAKNCIKELRK